MSPISECLATKVGRERIPHDIWPPESSRYSTADGPDSCQLPLDLGAAHGAHFTLADFLRSQPQRNAFDLLSCGSSIRLFRRARETAHAPRRGRRGRHLRHSGPETTAPRNVKLLSRGALQRPSLARPSALLDLAGSGMEGSREAFCSLSLRGGPAFARFARSSGVRCHSSAWCLPRRGEERRGEERRGAATPQAMSS